MFTGILQPTHLIILLAVALIFLGPKRLPDAGRALGQGLREFKDSMGNEPRPRLPEPAETADEETPAVRLRRELAGDEHRTWRAHDRQSHQPRSSPPAPHPRSR